MKILLLEDDYSLHIAIKESIELANHTVDSFYDGLIAFDSMNNDYDLFILDINVPNLNGIELLEHIKKTNPKANVIMISANIDIDVLKEAYSSGCDDYLKKPFDITELILKINRLDTNSDICEVCGYIYDKTKRRLLADKEEISLTNKEAKLIHLLITNKDTIISKEQIIDFVYDGISPLDSSFRSLLRRLRQKLPENCIETIPTRGYRFNTNKC